ncbi:MAG: VRR-NUC domain-containing protein [Clostridia bacterium]
MLERDIERALGENVRRAGGLYYKFTSPGNDGVPDRIVSAPGGRVVFVELKTDAGRLSKLQARQIDKLMRAGCTVRVVWGARGVEAFTREVLGECDLSRTDTKATASDG